MGDFYSMIFCDAVLSCCDFVSGGVIRILPFRPRFSSNGC